MQLRATPKAFRNDQFLFFEESLQLFLDIFIL